MKLLIYYTIILFWGLLKGQSCYINNHHDFCIIILYLFYVYHHLPVSRSVISYRNMQIPCILITLSKCGGEQGVHLLNFQHAHKLYTCMTLCVYEYMYNCVCVYNTTCRVAIVMFSNVTSHYFY